MRPYMDPIEVNKIWIWPDLEPGSGVRTNNWKDKWGPLQTNTIQKAHTNHSNKPFLQVQCLILWLVTYYPKNWWNSFLFNLSVFDTQDHFGACQLFCKSPLCILDTLMHFLAETRFNLLFLPNRWRKTVQWKAKKSAIKQSPLHSNSLNTQDAFRVKGVSSENLIRSHYQQNKSFSRPQLTGMLELWKGKKRQVLEHALGRGCRGGGVEGQVDSSTTWVSLSPRSVLPRRHP